jgi:hypothetical protein
VERPGLQGARIGGGLGERRGTGMVLLPSFL